MDALAAKQIAGLSSGAICIGSTSRRRHATTSEALAPVRAVRVNRALVAGWTARALETAFTRRAVHVGHAHRRDRLAISVWIALEPGRTIRINRTLRWRLFADAANTTLGWRAIEVSHAHQGSLTDLVDTNLRRVALRIRLAFPNELALEVQAALTGTTLVIKRAADVRDAEAKFTDLV